MGAYIQFVQGVNEETVPDIRLTRSRTGNSGTAVFRFDDPKVLDPSNTEEITGMYLLDEEGEISTREVKGKFVNGQARAIEATVILNSEEEWDRFMRFMDRYAETNGLGLERSE